MSQANQFYDQKAVELLQKLNSNADGVTNDLDALWSHPTTGGTIYVGNQTAAAKLELLQSRGITHVVNCTQGSVPNFHEGVLKYYSFAIGDWNQHVTEHPASAIAFTQELFRFINEAVQSGGSAFIHCLAGAHRAGTTGCACLIHFGRLPPEQAVAAAKACRPIIDPIADFPIFLNRVFEGEKEMGSFP